MVSINIDYFFLGFLSSGIVISQTLLFHRWYLYQRHHASSSLIHNQEFLEVRIDHCVEFHDENLPNNYVKEI